MSCIPDRSSIERRSLDLIDRYAPPVSRSTADDVCSRVLADVVSQAQSSTVGGKRLRARLALASYLCLHGEHMDAMLDLACAIEIFQTAALVHDDIIDDSDLRRGQPSAHRALGNRVHSARIGRGLGLMLGDVLATCSIDAAATASSSLCNAGLVVSSFLTMQRDVGVGQVMDLGVELTPLSEPRELVGASLNVFRWKTASYTTIAPLELGFLASGSWEPADCVKAAHAIGEPLGVAFQLEDDLLDVVGSPSSTGKPVGGDIREGKRTVLLADAIDSARPSDRQTLISIFEKRERTDEDVRTAAGIFESSGALEKSRQRIAHLWSQAVMAIDSCRLDDTSNDLLRTSCMEFVPMMGHARKGDAEPLN
ncbi:polyprenyl synthetase family protein [uncultured Bifidobacterium sp.]|uniref:polyprenyl synthetase family protein n=1 Tax=uncultured Bifidobacterium sp. TaxID=165187 RepID=UPI00260D1035|nr:polyprenyl synthetase family protein [uncultured Bifidobacterium sp.]